MDYLEFIINLEKQKALLKVAASERESWFRRHPYLTAAGIIVPLSIGAAKILGRWVDLFGTQSPMGKLREVLSQHRTLLSNIAQDLRRELRNLSTPLKGYAKMRDILKQMPKRPEYIGYI
jgi:hypothetical protein